MCPLEILEWFSLRHGGAMRSGKKSTPEAGEGHRLFEK